MKALHEYRTRTDKQEWGEGPWLTEPDKVQWVDEATGLDCLIVRNRMGALCGYVGVPEGHPLHGLDYGQCPSTCPLPEPTDWDNPVFDESPLLREAGKNMDARMAERGERHLQHCEHSPDSVLEVHGGITYADRCQEATEEQWRRWAAAMRAQRDKIQMYPRGDAAADWRLLGQYVDDFAGWKQWMEASNICHLVEPGRPDNIWWFGFDCGHSGDLVPYMVAMYHDGRFPKLPPLGGMFNEVYRDVQYVEQECAALAAQLYALAPSAVRAALTPNRRQFAKEGQV